MLELITLRDKARTLEPLIRIGKKGLTEGAINEIKDMLKKRRLIKIKMLNAFVSEKNQKELAKEVAEKTEATLVESIGNIIVLSKK